VASIKLTGTGGKEMVIAFNDEQKLMFQNMAACIATQAKTLHAP
jgi:hypothetical protein